jgi:hypothetical protein
MMPTRRPTRRFLPALLLTLALGACGSSSTEPAVDAKLLQERLDTFVAAVTAPDPASEVVAKAEGKATVETAGDGTVTATLPRLTISSTDGNSAVLDPVTLRFTNGGDGLVNVEAKLPGSLSIKDKEGKVAGEIQIGSQALKAVWADKLQSLTNVDMRLTNLAIKSAKGTGTGSIGQIAFTGGLEAKGGGLYDGRYDMTVSGFNVNDPEQKSTIKVGTFSLVNTIKGARMEDWATAAKEAGYTLANPNVFKAWTGGTLDPKVLAFLKRMPELMGDVSYTYALNGVDVSEAGKKLFGLKTSSMGFGVSADGKGTTKLRMSLGLGGVSGGEGEDILPPEADIQNAVMEIDASGIPGKQLWDIYVDALPALQAQAAKAASETASGNADAAASNAELEQVGSEMSAKAMMVLSAAKLSIAMNQLNLTTPTASVAGKGAMSYLPAQSLMPEGKISFRFTGIDALAAAMQKRGRGDETAQQIMGMASAIRAMGRPDATSPANNRAYVIDVVFGKDGSVTANGQRML